jgi:hypothetical protein
MKNILIGLVVLVGGLCLGVAACGDGGSRGSATPPARCSTGNTWTGGEESALMDPGDDCIGCHAKGEGPRFDIAGTVMNDSHDDTNCDGVSDVQVVITGADGTTLTLTANSAGNFSHSEKGSAVMFPIHAKVVANGKERAMVSPQSTGACNSCHTADGLNGAPGRIVAPM